MTAPIQPVAPTDGDAMTLMEHLVELRTRLTRAALGVLIGMIIGFVLIMPQGPVELINVIINTFAAPLPGQAYAPVQSVGTTEQFTSFMKVALMIGIMLAMPVIVFQLYAFIVPGLTDRERRMVLVSLPFVTLFFAAGVAFGWFITVPTAIRFLIGFSSSELIQSQPTLSDFLDTVTMLLLINGIVFELPVIILTLAFIGVVTAQQLAGYRRYAMVLVVIIAALITPTGDPVNLLLLAVPMYLLYEVGIILARLVPKRP